MDSISTHTEMILFGYKWTLTASANCTSCDHMRPKVSNSDAAIRRERQRVAHLGLVLVRVCTIEIICNLIDPTIHQRTLRLDS